MVFLPEKENDDAWKEGAQQDADDQQTFNAHGDTLTEKAAPVKGAPKRSSSTDH